MSYHEIEVLPSYTLKCRQCAYEGWARTAGLAEQQAISHINSESSPPEYAMLNYDHTVEIIATTVVGRNL